MTSEIRDCRSDGSRSVGANPSSGSSHRSRYCILSMPRFERRYSADIHRTFRARQIVVALEVDPKARAVAEELAEANRHLGGNRLLLVQDVVERPAGKCRGPRPPPSCSCQERAGRPRAGFPPDAPGRWKGVSRSSVIVLCAQVHCAVAVPSECDAHIGCSGERRSAPPDRLSTDESMNRDSSSTPASRRHRDPREFAATSVSNRCSGPSPVLLSNNLEGPCSECSQSLTQANRRRKNCQVMAYKYFHTAERPTRFTPPPDFGPREKLSLLAHADPCARAIHFS